MNTIAPAVPQSTFVTVLAWVLIIFNAFGIFGALMQNVMVNFVMPSVMDTAQGQPQFPLTVFRVLALLFFCITAFMTYAAYAFLKRRNWARRTFIAIFGLSIAWLVFCILAFGFGFGLADFPPAGQGAVPREMRTMMTVMLSVFGIFAVGMTVLLAWLIKRLRSPSVKAEFQRGNVVT